MSFLLQKVKRVEVPIIGIKPLKVRHDVIKLDLTIPLVYWYWFEHSTHVSYIVHDLWALGSAQKIQVLGSL